VSTRDIVAPIDLIHEALDAVLTAGFATLEQGTEAVEARRKLVGWEGLSTGDWIDIIKAHARTDLDSLRASSRPWRGSALSVDLDQYQGRWQLHLRCAMGFHASYYQAALAAYQLLEAEGTFLKADLHRIWRKLLREVDEKELWKDRSRVNAFDWYVVHFDALVSARCRIRRPLQATAAIGGAP
jgi:hypothetical protein